MIGLIETLWIQDTKYLATKFSGNSLQDINHVQAGFILWCVPTHENWSMYKPQTKNHTVTSDAEKASEKYPNTLSCLNTHTEFKGTS